MDGFGKKDAFVVRGKTFQVEQGKRYRISWKDGCVYEGTYLGYLDIHPLCNTITLVDVAKITGHRAVKEAGKIFYSFEKRGIMNLEEIGHDLAALLRVIASKYPEENERAELN